MRAHRRSPMKSNDETSNMPLVLVYVAALIHFFVTSITFLWRLYSEPCHIKRKFMAGSKNIIAIVMMRPEANYCIVRLNL